MSTGLEFLPDFDASALEQSVYVGPNRRSSHLLDRLSRRLDRVCSTAVDALQIAAMLESDGISDRIAREEYGFTDVFELAEELYRRVPARPLPRLAVVQDNGARRMRREISKGLLFALPGLFYPAAFAVYGVQAGTLGLTLAAIAGWAWSQAMVNLAYRLMGRGDPRGAARLLMELAILGVVGLTGTMILASRIEGDLGGSAVTLAAGQMAYQMAAAILFMFERELWLFVALIPGVAVNLAHIMLGTDAVSPLIALAAGTGSIALTLIAAFGQALRAAFGQRGTPAILRFRDLWATVPFVVYGAACASFIAFDTLQFWIRNLEPAPPSLGVAVVPLVLSMGVLEWQLRRFRERGVECLGISKTRKGFSRRVRRTFVDALKRYTLTLVGLSLVAWLVTFALRLEGVQPMTLLTANAALGVGFFAAFILIGQNRIVTAFGALFIAALVRALELTSLSVAFLPHEFSLYYLAGCLVFMLLALVAVHSDLTTVSHYR